MVQVLKELKVGRLFRPFDVSLELIAPGIEVVSQATVHLHMEALVDWNAR